MKTNRRQRLRVRLQNVLFHTLLVLVLALVAWLSQQYRYTADWTATERNTLTGKSHDVIERLDGPVEVTAFVGEDARVRTRIEELLDRYRRAGADISSEFINPELRPSLARELEIRGSGEMIVRMGEASERLQRISEQSITNALTQLDRDRTRWIVFVQGHGERAPLGKANFDLGIFGRQLRQRGYRVQTLNLALQPTIPDNTDLLVLASPRDGYLPGELARIQQYVDAGRNLLWLREPGTAGRSVLGDLPGRLGVDDLPGIVVDASDRLRGRHSPDFALAADYPAHPATKGFSRVSLFPRSLALQPVRGHGWQHRPLVRTHARSWTERDALETGARIAHDPDQGEIAGPLTLGITAQRGDGRQRVAVIGDGDWLSNAYVGNGGNLDLGLRLFGWLVGDDEHMTIVPDRAPDLAVELSRPALTLLGSIFLLILPLLLAAGGALVWVRRRRR